ncbi:MAG: hypothetical protein ACI4GD_08965 [Lachnospiraceae bacterium]
MESRILVKVTDYGNQDTFIVTGQGNVQDAFCQMLGLIKKEQKFPCSISTIPDIYYEKFGLAKEKLPVIELQETILVENEMQKLGINFASCRDCDSFTDGSCGHWGGICDPDDECDHIHSNNIFLLSYEDSSFQSYICLSESKPIQEIIDILSKDSDSNAVKDIVMADDYDESHWILQGTV